MSETVRGDKMESMQFGDWKLERILGSGTYGKVMLLRNRVSDEAIAVKKCHTGSSSGTDLDSWMKEIEILSSLKHPGLVSTLALPEGLEALNREAPLLCMEYCSGGDLRQCLNKPKNCCGLPEKDVLHITRDIASAIIYLHSVRVVHRDLKPENIVIQLLENSRKSYKLIDLGFAKNLERQSLCHTLVGTLQYLAPELFNCEKYTNTVDYWSLGLIVHECITGVRPFLPGLPPIQWMQQVELKSHNDICIYAHPNGQVIFSQRLFKENHLSSVMQLMMEDWLRSMLEWNPALRGRDLPPDPSHPGPIVAFEKLDRMFKTEVAFIFWVEGLAHLCYEVGEDVTMDEIRERIERDTGVSRQYQLIVLPRGQCPDETRSARQLLVTGTEGEEPISTACLFSKFNDGSECRLTQSYPEFLEVMLLNPRQETEYRVQKRMWAQSVFFVGHQNSLYRKLFQALKIHSAYMTLRAAILKQQMDCINESFRHANSCHDLFVNSLKLDQLNYKLQSQRGGLPSSALLEKWSKEEILLQNGLEELHSRCTLTDQLLQRTISAVGETAKSASLFLCKPLDLLDKCSQSALDLYSSLLKRPKEQRDMPEENVAMTKVVVKALKHRNQLFTDCFTQIRIVEKSSAEIDSFAPQLLLLKNDIDQFQEQMLLLQNQRQNDIWTLLERAVVLWQRTSLMNQQGPAASPDKDDSTLVSLPSLSAAKGSTHESLKTIQENQTLRYQVQDSLARGLSATCTSTPYGLDWSFLNQE